MNIKEYIDSIDTASYSEVIISIALYDKETGSYLYLFNSVMNKLKKESKVYEI